MFAKFFRRLSPTHTAVTKELIELAIKADDTAHDMGIITMSKTLNNLRSLRNDLVAISNGDDITVTPEDPRLASLELAVKTHKLL